MNSGVGEDRARDYPHVWKPLGLQNKLGFVEGIAIFPDIMI